MDHPVCSLALALLTPIFIAFVIVGSSRFQHGIDHYKQFTGQGNRSPFGTLLLLYPPVPVCEISVPFSGDHPGNLTEHALKIGIALVDMNAFSLACALIVARA